MEKAQLIIVIFKFFVFLSISAAFFNNKVCVGKKLLTCPKFISRTEWKARKSYGSEPLIYIPTPYVVVHHGGIDQHCFNESSCSHIVKSYQNLHMDKNHWNDIGYNFLVGEDGNVYEGRGWDSVGAHAPGYNTQSIGVCMIGNFNNTLPKRPALKALKSFIKCGVGFGKIAKDYFLIGHRQTRPTICPGQALYEYVKHQQHWISKPKPIFNNESTITTYQYESPE
ncbi:PREDICTED: peptidoglycan-recognition protein 1-like [Ceratosolen solmsi marchali]|uniref:Peptidoglycan-recognition protein 1-like n=1 Tax=Ceratosolen solmsi marchali TaxID=326594 RepID=A0AAJ6YFP9_9HYME|nr:PREDICTED: peptidoglycan-recognition protein 1-like [Ceratosolen solmsi marchali]